MQDNKYFDSQLNKMLDEISWSADGLVPVIAQDENTKEVLMLAYMNKEALTKTIKEKKACYYSRSRGKLWVKGETSGNCQEVRDIAFDCDKDAVLILVRQTGVACHEDYYSCFHYNYKQPDSDQGFPVNENKDTTERNGIFTVKGKPGQIPPLPLGRNLELLKEVICQRNQERPEGSYTTYLFEKGLDKILKKVGEECAEVIIAAKNNSKEEISYEVADLFYHLLVMLEDQDVSLEDISLELESRRK